uniref:Uncharacterized protein n=1 Tax=Pithovirus LCDPAC01 TaxID=2506600 RepID=A0A481YQE9_9VIRU|nr:MAG: hypothetical protein LCDPAC01_01240 [Pithovirus LCDPAC01]
MKSLGHPVTIALSLERGVILEAKYKLPVGISLIFFSSNLHGAQYGAGLHGQHHTFIGLQGSSIGSHKV